MKAGLTLLTILFVLSSCTSAPPGLTEYASGDYQAALERISEAQADSRLYSTYQPIYELLLAESELSRTLATDQSREEAGLSGIRSQIAELSAAYSSVRNASSVVHDTLFSAGVPYRRRSPELAGDAYGYVQESLVAEAQQMVSSDSVKDFFDVLTQLNETVLLLDIQDASLWQDTADHMASEGLGADQALTDGIFEYFFVNEIRNAENSFVTNVESIPAAFDDNLGDFSVMQNTIRALESDVAQLSQRLTAIRQGVDTFSRLASQEAWNRVDQDLRDLADRFSGARPELDRIRLEMSLAENRQAFQSLVELADSLIYEERRVVRVERQEEVRSTAERLRLSVLGLQERADREFLSQGLKVQGYKFELADQLKTLDRLLYETSGLAIDNLDELNRVVERLYGLHPDEMTDVLVRFDGVTRRVNFVDQNRGNTAVLAFLNVLAHNSSSNSWVELDNVPQWINDLEGYDALRAVLIGINEDTNAATFARSVKRRIEGLFSEGPASDAAEIGIDAGDRGDTVMAVTAFQIAFFEQRARGISDESLDTVTDSLVGLFDVDRPMAALATGYTGIQGEIQESSTSFFTDVIQGLSALSGEALAVLSETQLPAEARAATYIEVHPFVAVPPVAIRSAEELLARHRDSRSARDLVRAQVHAARAAAWFSVTSEIGQDSVSSRLELAGLSRPSIATAHRLVRLVETELGHYKEAIAIEVDTPELERELYSAAILESMIFDRRLDLDESASWREKVVPELLEAFERGASVTAALGKTETTRLADLAQIYDHFAALIESRALISMGLYLPGESRFPRQNPMPVNQLSRYTYINNANLLNLEAAAYTAGSGHEMVFEEFRNDGIPPALGAAVMVVQIAKYTSGRRSIPDARRTLDALQVRALDGEPIERLYHAIGRLMLRDYEEVESILEAMRREFDQDVGVEFVSVVRLWRAGRPEFRLRLAQLQPLLSTPDAWSVLSYSPAREQIGIQFVENGGES